MDIETKPTASIFRDWQLRATDIADEVVFKENISDKSRQLTCWLNEMSDDITNKLGKPRLEGIIKDCDEVKIGGLTIPVSDYIKNGILIFNVDGVTFKVHQSVLVEDAKFCADSVLQIREKNEDIMCMENPIVEMGIPREIDDLDVAQAFPQDGVVSFYKHKATGRLWACAIDKLTESPNLEYRHTTVQHIAQHEFYHIMELNPDVNELVEKVALKLDKIRSIPDKDLRKTAVEELVNVGFALNSKYCPGKIIEWADGTMDKSNRGVQGRHSPRLRKKDTMLAKELVVEALTFLRADKQTFAKELETPTTHLKEMFIGGMDFDYTAIKWSSGKNRKPVLIPIEQWRPEVRLVQTPSAYGYSKPLTAKTGAKDKKKQSVDDTDIRI